MRGEMSMAPIITAVEFMFSPTEATIMAKIRIHRLVPLKTISLRMVASVFPKSSSSGSRLR